MEGLKLKYAVVFVPLVLGLAYMYLHEDLSATATILIACLLFTAVMMFFVFKVSEADLKATEKKGEDKVDRSMFKTYKTEPLADTCKRINDATEQPSGSTVSLFHYLRETVRSDVLAAVEVVELGAIEHCLQRLLSANLDAKSAVACLELTNELLSNMQAKVKLLRNIGSLHSTVDAALHWCVVLVAAALRLLQIPADTLKLTGVLLTGKADVNSVGTAGDVVQFAAGEGADNRAEQLLGLVSKTLVLLGLLCSDESPDAQTRLNDRGGVMVLLSVLDAATLMCSTSSGSAGIGAVTKASASAAVAGVGALDRAARRKHSVMLVKWACWCLFNLSLEHPPSKARIFQLDGIRSVADAIKAHPQSVHAHRQGLALLFNLIAPDSYAKYNIAQARQSLLANGITDVLEHAKVEFKKERDIVNTCRAISNSIMVDFS